MTLPKVIYAYDTSDPLGGIISKIKKYSNDPISDNLVATQAINSAWGQCKYAVTWEGNFASVDSSTDAYLIIQFPGRYLFPSYYTIRGVSTAYNYQLAWTVHGYNRGEESDPKKWTLLGDNVSTATTFCSNGSKCITTKKSTIFSMIPTNKGFEFIRFKTTSGTSSTYHFTTSGIEFFGSLSINKKFHYNSVNCKHQLGNSGTFIAYMFTVSLIAS